MRGSKKSFHLLGRHTSILFDHINSGRVSRGKISIGIVRIAITEKRRMAKKRTSTVTGPSQCGTYHIMSY